MSTQGRFLYVGVLGRLGLFSARWGLGSQHSFGHFPDDGALDRLGPFFKSLDLYRQRSSVFKVADFYLSTR